MTNNQETQALAIGCLSRVFTLAGLFWLGAVGFSLLRELDSGFDVDMAGAFIPALAFLIAGNVMRKRAKEARARSDSFSAPSTPSGTHRATTKPPKIERGPTPTPIVAQPSERVEPRKPRPDRPIPELPPLEPAPEPGKLAALEDLDISDFEATGKALSSEERIRLAREKYLERKPPTRP